MLRQSSSALRRNVSRSTSERNNDIPMRDLSTDHDQDDPDLDSQRIRRDRTWYKDTRAKRKYNIISIIGLLLIVYVTAMTLLRRFTGPDVPQCRSIYMYPSYARIDGFSKQFTPLAQKYHLYLYREQDKDKEPLNDNHIQLNGIPVLFIPGNAGSFKQVRSIASACANLYFDSRDSIKNPKVKNVDFFTADFNEDFTAFHGQTMLDQAEYLNDAIAYILSLYEQSVDTTVQPLPESVIIVAHSMGGIVARVMPTLQNHVIGSINSIITLSSPHAAAPVTFDGDILKIYKRTNDFWRKQFEDDQSFFSKNMSLISITGSLQDNILPADYAAVQDLIPLKNGFTSYTTTIPGVWTTIDHLAIVWCKQLRFVISRLILEMTDVSIPSKTKSLEERINISQRLLLSGFENFYNHDSVLEYAHNIRKIAAEIDPSNPEQFHIIPSDKPLIISNRNEFKDIHKPFVFYIPKDLDAKFDFRLLTSGNKPDIKLCKDLSELTCISIEDDSLTIPRSTLSTNHPADSSVEDEMDPFVYQHLEHNYLTKYDLIIIDMNANNPLGNDDFIYASFSKVSPIEKLDMSQWHTLLHGIHKTVKSDSTVTTTDLEYLQQTDALLSYNVKVHSTIEDYEDLLFQPMIRQWVPTPSETKWYVNILVHNELEINMHNVAPFIPVNIKESHSLHLNVILPPGSSVKLNVTINWPLTFKMLFIRYRLAIGSIPIFFIALVLAIQFSHYNKTDIYESFSEVLAALLSKYSPLIFVGSLLLTPLTNSTNVQHILYLLDPVKLNRPFVLSSMNIFTNFYFLGIRNLEQSWIGLLFMWMSLGFIFVISTAIKLMKYAITRLSNTMTAGNAQTDDDLLKHKKLFDRKRTVACFLLIMAVTFYIPYQLAYVIATLIQAGTCIRIVYHRKKFGTIRKREYTNLENYNISLLILFLIVAIINVPVIIVFMHNLGIKYETTFRSHHNFIAVAPIILLISANSTFNIPTFPKYSFDNTITVGLFAYLSFFGIIYGTRNLYFIHDIVNIICGWLFYGSVTAYSRRG
ncbi:GPI inositol deacylase [Maudiozyma exigua]|uniref:GPI inositol-deacylase n=1 Tax=Maudiozyma exigua TaxID=34358 RepID=A0A9P6W8Y6_MAUEX|nr:GPI inositol deacylase [Kazachstania exigua]